MSSKLWQNIRRKVCLFVVILTFLSFLVLMVLAQVSNTMLSLNQLVTKSGMRSEEIFPNSTLVVIMTNPLLYYPNQSDTLQNASETYIMNNCQLNEMQRHGSNYLPINVDNIHFFTAHYTSFAFFEAPKKSKIGYRLRFLCPPKNPQPFYQTGIVPKSLDVFLNEFQDAMINFDYSVDSSVFGGYEYVVNQIGVNPIYLEPSSMTSVGMTRMEYFREKKLFSVEFSLQTSAVELREYSVGTLVVLYEWQNEYVYTFESYQNKNYISLIIVICTSVLAVERAIAFVYRVTKQSEELAEANQTYPDRNKNELSLSMSTVLTDSTSITKETNR